MNKLNKNKWRLATVICAVSVLAILVCSVGVHIDSPLSDSTIGIGQHQVTFTLGTEAHAAGTADYTCDGTDDDVQFQQALNALPAGGGKLVALTGDYSFSATVSRAIDNVTIEGMGDSTHLAYNGSTALFDAGSQSGWMFLNFRTDAGGVDVDSTTDYVITNVTVGTAVVGKITRAATFVVAASDSSAASKAQADYVCDGTDDQVEIQAAIDALPAGGGTILLLEGNCEVTATINLISNMVLTGQGDATVLNMSDSGTIISISGLENIIIRSLKVTGQYENGSSITGIVINDSDNVTVWGCTMDVLDGKGVNIVRSRYTRVESCFIDTHGSSYGIQVYAGSAPMFHHCRILHNFVGGPIKLDQGSDAYPYEDITIANNTIWGSIYAPFYLRNSTIENNILTAEDGYSNPSIYIKYGEKNKVLNNWVYDSAVDAIRLDESSRNLVDGNTCVDSLRRGVVVINNSNENVISNNHCSGCTSATYGDGIGVMTTCYRNIVKGNVCNNNAACGIILEDVADYTIIEGNVCFENDFDGIVIHKSNYCTIKGNIFKDNGQAATNTYSDIRIWGMGGVGSSHNIVEGNICRATLTNKVKYNISEEIAEDDYNIIRNNQVSGAVTAAINKLGTNSKVSGNMGWVTESVGTRVYRTVAQSIPDDILTYVEFDAERYDTDNIHESVSYPERLTCRTAGYYLITASVGFDANAVGSRMATIHHSGLNKEIVALRVPACDVPYYTHLTITTVHYLAVGDYVRLRVMQDSGDALDLMPFHNSSEFAMQRIG